MPYQNMTLQELARHIGMDAREVEKLAARGRLPGMQVGGVWRFNRAQMLEWLQQEMHALGQDQLRKLDQAMGGGDRRAVLAGVLAPEGVEMNLPARSKASVPSELVKLAERTGLVYDTELLVEKLLEREELCSTALPGGIAFPHPRHPLPFATAESLVCLGRVAGGVPYAAPDGQLTYLFALVCCHDDRRHLQTLARLSMMFQQGLAKQLIDLDSNDEALRLMLEAEADVLKRQGG